MKDKDFTSYNIENIYQFRFRTKKMRSFYIKNLKNTTGEKIYYECWYKKRYFLQLVGF